MSWIINEKEIENVIRLTPDKRYSYFIKKVADSEELWGLGSPEGMVLLGDKEGNEIIPVWPHAEYAKLFANKDWQDCIPEKIKLSEWFEYWLPGIDKDKRKISIFPVVNDLGKIEGTLVSTNTLKNDLKNEVRRYE